MHLIRSSLFFIPLFSSFSTLTFVPPFTSSTAKSGINFIYGNEIDGNVTWTENWLRIGWDRLFSGSTFGSTFIGKDRF
jgi:hypothetical protein